MELTNKMIAERVGFEKEGIMWLYPKPYSEYLFDLPDFLHSMDACIKWIVPELIAKECGSMMFDLDDKHGRKVNTCTLWQHPKKVGVGIAVSGEDDTISEAFCQAAMKYFSEVK